MDSEDVNMNETPATKKREYIEFCLVLKISKYLNLLTNLFYSN